MATVRLENKNAPHIRNVSVDSAYNVRLEPPQSYTTKITVPSEGISYLTNLRDVSISNLSDDDVIYYNSQTGTFSNKSIKFIDGGTF